MYTFKIRAIHIDMSFGMERSASVLRKGKVTQKSAEGLFLTTQIDFPFPNVVTSLHSRPRRGAVFVILCWP
jgi:hypothetical protein